LASDRRKRKGQKKGETKEKSDEGFMGFIMNHGGPSFPE